MQDPQDITWDDSQDITWDQPEEDSRTRKLRRQSGVNPRTLGLKQQFEDYKTAGDYTNARDVGEKLKLRGWEYGEDAMGNPYVKPPAGTPDRDLAANYGTRKPPAHKGKYDTWTPQTGPQMPPPTLFEQITGPVGGAMMEAVGTGIAGIGKLIRYKPTRQLGEGMAEVGRYAQERTVNSLPGRIAAGAGHVIPLLAIPGGALGMGAASGVQAYGKGATLPQAAIEGTKSGLAIGAAGAAAGAVPGRGIPGWLGRTLAGTAALEAPAMTERAIERQPIVPDVQELAASGVLMGGLEAMAGPRPRPRPVRRGPQPVDEMASGFEVPGFTPSPTEPYGSGMGVPGFTPEPTLVDNVGARRTPTQIQGPRVLAPNEQARMRVPTQTFSFGQGAQPGVSQGAGTININRPWLPGRDQFPPPPPTHPMESGFEVPGFTEGQRMSSGNIEGPFDYAPGHEAIERMLTPPPRQSVPRQRAKATTPQVTGEPPAARQRKKANQQPTAGPAPGPLAEPTAPEPETGGFSLQPGSYVQHPTAFGGSPLRVLNRRGNNVEAYNPRTGEVYGWRTNSKIGAEMQSAEAPEPGLETAPPPKVVDNQSAVKVKSPTMNTKKVVKAPSPVAKSTPDTGTSETLSPDMQEFVNRYKKPQAPPTGQPNERDAQNARNLAQREAEEAAKGYVAEGPPDMTGVPETFGGTKQGPNLEPTPGQTFTYERPKKVAKAMGPVQGRTLADRLSSFPAPSEPVTERKTNVQETLNQEPAQPVSPSESAKSGPTRTIPKVIKKVKGLAERLVTPPPAEQKARTLRSTSVSRDLETLDPEDMTMDEIKQQLKRPELYNTKRGREIQAEYDYRKLEGESGTVGQGPKYFSRAERILDQTAQKKYTPDQLLGMLKAKGARDSELEWSGLNDLVNERREKGQIITKDEALGLLRQNQIEIKEVTKKSYWKEQGEERAYESRQPRYDSPSLRLPGGSNYRELLFTLPDEVTNKRSLDEFAQQEFSAPYAKLTPEQQSYIREGVGGAGEGVYDSPHWDEPNVLAHVRLTDRVTPDGKRILFMEEAQSDWAKDLQQGYSTSKELPDMPYTKTWPALIMRRLVRMAADEGYDGIGWTTGKQQSERYDLAKHVDSLQVHEHPPTGNLDYPPGQSPTNVVGEPTYTLIGKKHRAYSADEFFDETDPLDLTAFTVEQHDGTADTGPAYYTIDHPQFHGNGSWDLPDEIFTRRFHVRHDAEDAIARWKENNGDINEDMARRKAEGYDETVVQRHNLTRKDLEEYVGKEMAARLINQPHAKQIEPDKIEQSMGINSAPNPEGSGLKEPIRGLDLTLGGETKDNLYDKQLVNIANNIGKKHGATETQSRIAVPRELSHSEQTRYDELVEKQGGDNPYPNLPNHPEEQVFTTRHANGTLGHVIGSEDYLHNDYLKRFPHVERADAPPDESNPLTPDERAELAGLREARNTSPVHVLELTPSMKEEAQTQGQELFPGQGGFITPELLGIPQLINAAKGAKDLYDDVRRFIAPVSRTAASRFAANTIREHNAQREVDFHRTAAQLDQTPIVKRISAAIRGQRLVETAGDVIARMPSADRLDFINRLETGLPQANPQLQGFADQMRQLLDSRRTQLQALGRLQNYYENYFPHIWKDPGQAANFAMGFYAKRPFEGTKKALKQRTFPTIADGLAWRGPQGQQLELKTDNPVDTILEHVRDIDRFIMAHNVVNEYMSRGVMVPIPARDLTAWKQSGWAQVDDKIGTIFAPPNRRGGISIQGYLVAPEPVANVLNNYLSPGLASSKHTGLAKAYRGYRATSNAMNAAQLGLSAFHLGFVTIDAATSKLALSFNMLAHGHAEEAVKTALGVPLAPLTYFTEGSKLMRELNAPGTQGRQIADIFDALVAGGARFGQDSQYATNITKNMMEAYQHGNLAGAAVRVPFALIEQAARPVMDYIVPRMKLGAAADMVKWELQRNPTMSHDELRNTIGKVWDSVDNRLGQLAYDNLFWNKVAKDVALATTRSVGWNLGTFRELIGGAVDAAKMPYDLARGNKVEVSHRTAYTLALPVVSATVGALLQAILTGYKTGHAEAPASIDDLYFPRTGETDEHGKPERVTPPGYMKDIYHYFDDPFGTISSKTHPAITTFLEITKNRDFFNTKIREGDLPHQALDTLWHIVKAYEPFGFRGLRREREVGADRLGQILPFLGITRAPRSVIDTPAEKLLTQYNAEGRQTAPFTKEEFERGQFKRKAILRIRQGKIDSVIDDIAKRYQDGKFSETDLDDVINKAAEPYLVNGVKALDFDKAVSVFERANKSEKEQLEQIIVDKAMSELDNRPGRDQAVMDALRRLKILE